MKRTNRKLSTQVKRRINKPIIKKKKEYDGDIGFVISTGSTLLDLAISGGRVRGGGLPAGILVEIFGPSGSGKTVMLSEIAGEIQRKGGLASFFDPEARLNKQFAGIFDLKVTDMAYAMPDTIPELFDKVRKWDPDTKFVNGIFADSLAALSTDIEMDKDEGDKMGMRRAKEFSEQLRKTCRLLVQKNLLMVCTNQIRENLDAGPYGVKYSSPGGKALGFYSSVRLRTFAPGKINKEEKIAGKKVKRVEGVRTQIEVFKNSVWKPYRKAFITIIFDYGIDDIRENLQFVKDHTSNTTYVVEDIRVGTSIKEAIETVEGHNYEQRLKDQVIDLWEEIESKFETERKKKKR